MNVILKSIAENPVALFIKLLPVKIGEAWSFAKGNARAANSRKPEKSLTDILMLTHALEKSYTLPERRERFGMKKATELASRLRSYISKYGYSDSLDVPISMLRFYISKQEPYEKENVEFKKIEDALSDIISRCGLSIDYFDKAGVHLLKGEDMVEAGKGDFKELASRRYSIRDFNGESIPDELIEEAIKIASKSPSACNRQGYGVHVFRGEDKDRIMEMQGGSAHFRTKASALIMITFRESCYYTRESSLGYVDGALFGMSLLYAFSYLGVASIPLTMALKRSLVKKIKKIFGIPVQETPVMMIAVGGYEKQFYVAKSYRNPVGRFVNWH